MNIQTHVIVGAGQAGSHAAIAMREAGFSGRIVLIGEERHLPYDRPPLSKAFITATERPEVSLFFAARRYTEAEIELTLNRRVLALDPNAQRVELDDGSTLAYDKLILATGSRPRRLAVAGGERALAIRTVDDAVAVRSLLCPGRKVVCIGAGVIGLEMAAAARTRGCGVTILEAGSGLMTRSLDRDMAATVLALHRRQGVEAHFGMQVAAIEADRVVCADGSLFPADIVIAGIGVERNTAIAAAAGLATGPGILVDETGETAWEGIFAAGEVASYFVPRLGRHQSQESWRHAQQHGSFVGRSTAGIKAVYDEIPWFWSDQHGVNIQVAGSVQTSTTIVQRGHPATGSASAFHLDVDGRLVAVIGIDAPRDVAAGLRLIRTGLRVDPAVLSDTTLSPQKLVAQATLVTT